MENQAKPSCGASDLRIFVIALLTSIIVIALYHFGTAYCRMMCRSKACPPGGVPAQVFVISAQPRGEFPHFKKMHRDGCRDGFCKPHRGKPGDRRMMREGKRPMPPKGVKRPPVKAPATPAPAAAPAAPATPAPAAAPAK